MGCTSILLLVLVLGAQAKHTSSSHKQLDSINVIPTESSSPPPTITEYALLGGIIVGSIAGCCFLTITFRNTLKPVVQVLESSIVFVVNNIKGPLGKTSNLISGWFIYPMKNMCCDGIRSVDEYYNPWKVTS